MMCGDMLTSEIERGRYSLRREVGQRPKQHVVRLSNVHIVLYNPLLKLWVLDKLHHRIRPVGDDVSARLHAAELLDDDRRDLVRVRAAVVGAAVVGEQPREAAHLAARVARFLELPMMVHDSALPVLVAAR